MSTNKYFIKKKQKIIFQEIKSNGPFSGPINTILLEKNYSRAYQLSSINP